MSGPLRVGCYLGHNVQAMLARLVTLADERGGLSMRVVSGEAPTSAEARREVADCDIVWMCGALAETLMAEGLLHHDVVAAPVFAGTAGPWYHSVIVARLGGAADLGGTADLSGAGDLTVAINERDSWSGNHALRHHLGQAWFGAEVLTGSHLASIEAVVSGEADVAAIDHSIWDALRGGAGAAAGLRVIDRTADWPSPPVLLSRRLEHGAAAAAVRAFLCGVGPGEVAGLDGFAAIDRDPYRPMRLPSM